MVVVILIKNNAKNLMKHLFDSIKIYLIKQRRQVVKSCIDVLIVDHAK